MTAATTSNDNEHPSHPIRFWHLASPSNASPRLQSNELMGALGHTYAVYNPFPGCYQQHPRLSHPPRHSPFQFSNPSCSAKVFTSQPGTWPLHLTPPQRLWSNELMGALGHTYAFSNPSRSAKIFTSQLGVDHAADFYALVRPCGGLVPLLTKTLLALSSLPQTLSSLSQAHMLPALSLIPKALRTPFTAPPPPHYTGVGGSPINDPDGDLNADPHAAADDGDGPFFAPLGNALDTLDNDFTPGWSLTPPGIVFAV
ncbi:hypothetical protein DFH29DRAFT_880412 [Suillus ampliporus]|nr:hypothetical protein DFH29DRAFT_880412 [Suillus ampliporus]